MIADIPASGGGGAARARRGGLPGALAACLRFSSLAALSRTQARKRRGPGSPRISRYGVFPENPATQRCPGGSGARARRRLASGAAGPTRSGKLNLSCDVLVVDHLSDEVIVFESAHRIIKQSPDWEAAQSHHIA